MSHATHLPDDHGHAAHSDAGHDHGGIAKYVYVFLALCFLTTMSFFTYSDLWPWPDAAVKRLFMTAVSCTKAMLVILFFMHVKYEANWKYVLTIPASIMSVFLCLALVPDIGARVNGLFGYRGRYSEERWEHVGREEDVEVMVTASKHGAGGHAGGEAEVGDGSEAAAIAAEHDPAIEVGPDDTKARAADVKEGSNSSDENPGDGEEPSDEGDEADRSAATRKAVPGITTSGDDADDAGEAD
jgi:cytochrome c oxidase subunit IV